MVDEIFMFLRLKPMKSCYTVWEHNPSSLGNAKGLASLLELLHGVMGTGGNGARRSQGEPVRSQGAQKAGAGGAGACAEGRQGYVTGNKPELAALLVERFGKNSTEQFKEIETAVKRGLSQVTLKVNQPATPAISAAPSAVEAAPAPALAGPMPLALTRKRRSVDK